MDKYGIVKTQNLQWVTFKHNCRGFLQGLVYIRLPARGSGTRKMSPQSIQLWTNRPYFKKTQMAVRIETPFLQGTYKISDVPGHRKEVII